MDEKAGQAGDAPMDFTGTDRPTEEVGEYSGSIFDAGGAPGEDATPSQGADKGSLDTSLPQGATSQTGRLDNADPRGASGANAGTGTFSRADDSERDIK